MFLIVILPLFAASIILLLNMKDSFKEKTLSAAMTNADNMKYRIIDIVESTESILETASANGELIRFLNNDFQSETDYFKFYSSNNQSIYTNSVSQIQNVCVYVEREDFVYSSEYLYASEDIRQSEWYRYVMKNPNEIRWDVIKNPYDEEYYLAAVKAVTDGDRVYGVIAAMISNEWISRFISAEHTQVILSVNKGLVYYSSYPAIAAGTYVDAEDDFYVSSIQQTYDYGFFDYEGYTVLNNFYERYPFQIIMLLPSYYIDYELNRISLVYGGYCALTLILSVLIIILFTSIFTRRIKLLSEKMHTVASGNFDVDLSDTRHDEIAQLYTDLHQMIKSMQKLMKDVYNSKLQNEAFKLNQMEAEFKALSSQINPHFLYNTLETIRMKAFCNNDKETADLVKKLGKFMRRCLEFKDGEVTLRSELEFTNSYLELQSARFGDRVSYSIYSEVAKDYMILPLIIQPLVENAFVHGVEGAKANGKIDIRVYYHNELVVIDVTDNGCGMTDEKLSELKKKLELNDTSSGKSIGLTNVNKRIKMYHGEQYGMTVKTKLGAGTTITVTLPRKPVKKNLPEIKEREEN